MILKIPIILFTIESDLFLLPNLEKNILESIDLLKMNIIKKEIECCNIFSFNFTINFTINIFQLY